MIKAVYYPDEYRLSVAGHALAAPKGEDPVCAAASILIHTLAENVRTLEAMGALHEMSIRLDPGDAEISCVPCKQTSAIAGLVYLSIITGYRLLGQAYPEAVNFEEKISDMGLETRE